MPPTFLPAQARTIWAVANLFQAVENESEVHGPLPVVVGEGRLDNCSLTLCEVRTVDPPSDAERALIAVLRLMPYRDRLIAWWLFDRTEADPETRLKRAVEMADQDIAG